MINLQSAKVYFSEYAIINTSELENSWQLLFWELKNDGNLVVKSKVHPLSGSVVLR